MAVLKKIVSLKERLNGVRGVKRDCASLFKSKIKPSKQHNNDYP